MPNHTHAAGKQPEAAARDLQAADIRAPGIQSAASFAQLQVRTMCPHSHCIVSFDENWSCLLVFAQ